LEGSFNSYEHDEALRETFRKLADENKSRVIVDFSEVFFFNSTAIRGLISGNAFIKRKNGKIVFYNLSDYINNIFDITNLNMTFSICESKEEALEALDKDDEA
ncbi:MAG: STAS domain-containing protein, partial [Bacteroidota bacterium]